MSYTVDGLLEQISGAVIWTCARGHILGITTRKRSGGHWHQQLLKFRHAAKSINDSVEVDATIEGTVRDIACDACPEDARLKRTWYYIKDK